MIGKFILGVLAALLFLLSGIDAKAAAVCTLSASGMDFGEVSGSVLTDTGAIVISCVGNGNVDYVITLTTGHSGRYGLREMTNGAATLSYNLYSETTLSSIWGNGTGGSVVVSGRIKFGSDRLAVVSVPMFGRVPPQQEPTPGSYTDTITAKMTYAGPTATTAFQVSGRVVAQCNVSATDLAFASYAQVQLDQQSAIAVTCTNSTPWNLGLNQGTSPGATVTSRKMSRFGSGSGSLSYGLFRNAARTLNWGNTVGTDTLSGSGTGVAQSIPVYGRISGSQSPPTGGYRDTITATLTF